MSGDTHDQLAYSEDFECREREKQGVSTQGFLGKSTLSEHSEAIKSCPGLDRAQVRRRGPDLSDDAGPERRSLGPEKRWRRDGGGGKAENKLRERNTRVCAKPWSVQTGRGRR